MYWHTYLDGPVPVTVGYLEPFIDNEILKGASISRNFDASTLVSYPVLKGSAHAGTSIICGKFVDTQSLKMLSISIGTPSINWIKWSEIGSLDFTITQGNVAGEMPLAWKGPIYAVIKMGKSIAVYGENGISTLFPVQNNWGMKTINKTGVLCKTAVWGSEEEHFFIDNNYNLFKNSDQGISLLGYSEFLSQLTNPSIVFEPINRILYISDGTLGFMYDIDYNSFASGPANITGCGMQDDVRYITTDDNSYLQIPFHICTDAYDFGNRKPKTITKIDIGTNIASGNLIAMIEYRVSNTSSFVPTSWVRVNPDGVAHIPCYGIEFKFHIKSLTFKDIKIDYLTISGNFHQFTYLERID
jgi:hypothetical protein